MERLKRLRDEIWDLPMPELYALFAEVIRQAIKKHNSGGSYSELAARVDLALSIYKVGVAKESGYRADDREGGK